MKGILFAGVALLVGCSSDNNSIEPKISGYYKVVSVTSSLSVDMNNDGIRSEDIYHEISDPFHNRDLGDAPESLYDFESPQNFMEIRPLENSTNRAKLISVNFPYQVLFANSIGQIVIGYYGNSFTDYAYEIDAQGNMELTHINNSHSEAGTPHDMVASKGKIDLKITRNIFDFLDEEWKNDVVLTVHYEIIVD